ncbi:MAG: DUF885 family protein [Planctomycetota bacterium]
MTRILPLLLLSVACAGAAAAPQPIQDRSGASMPELVERYSVDRNALERFYSIGVSEARRGRLTAFHDAWLTRLAEVDFGPLDTSERIDHVLLRTELEYQRGREASEHERLARLAELLPFAADIVALEEARWSVEPIDFEAVAGALHRLGEAVAAVRERVELEDAEPEEAAEPAEDDEPDAAPLAVRAVDAFWLAPRVDDLRRALGEWYRHYHLYAPGFAWWCEEPYERLVDELEGYAEHLRETVAGQTGEDDDPLLGDPIGADGLAADLALEIIPYSPAELIAIGERQFAWCEAEMKRAAAEMGLGDDWKAALERVKSDHAPPGGQDALVLALAEESIAFLDERELVTIPALCRETWRVRMISKGGQRFLPFAAYGGQRMDVAFPTADMEHDSKRMAMRGNNVHFTRAITHHELIPGHHLQGFMEQRHATHRREFDTPFLGEGWALYWEMLLWDLGWHRSPENRIGMLFWRMHRAARIVVSLGFHLERMSPEEMIDFLVERVGHERDNATAEVRRFIGGAYSPLYQCAYMIGGLQLMALRAELVDSGRMTNREYHDAILHQGPVPIEMIRAALLDQPPARDHRAAWRFAGEVQGR